MTRCYLKICVTVPFTVGNFENMYAMRFISLFKIFKSYVDYTSSAKCWENVLGILDNCICIVYRRFSPLRREYLSSAVKVLTKSPKG